MKHNNLKRTLVGLGLMAALSSAATAIDVKASIMMRGEMMRLEKEKDAEKSDVYFLMNNQARQIDNPGDGIELTLDGGVYGAHLSMWYKSAKNDGQQQYDDDDWSAYFRRTYGWFKPIDALTLRFGYVGNDKFFKEKIDQWKVGSPFAITERDWAAHPLYINCNDVEGWGFGVECTPIEGLILNAGIAPGVKGAVDSDGNDQNYEGAAGIYKKGTDEKVFVAPWGIGAKYYWNNFEFQASYRDGGMSASREGTWSVARFGVGYKDQRTFSFIQPILGFDYNKTDKKWEMNGMCFDMYSEVYYDALTVMLHAPLTLRWSGAEKDYSYLETNLKVKYNVGSFGNLDDVSPYVQIGSNQDDAKWDKPITYAWLLNGYFADSFNLSYTAGVSCKVGAAEVDLGLKFDQYSNLHKAAYGKEYGFSVPFVIKYRKI